MGLFSALFGNKKSVDYKQMIAQGAIIIDVRSPAEYTSGHIASSKNIPLDGIKSKLDLIKSWNAPIITCCKSGARSGIAKTLLSSAGITVYNGGAWNMLQDRIK